MLISFIRTVILYSILILVIRLMTVISVGHVLYENLPMLGKPRAWVDEVLREYQCCAKDVYLLSCTPGGTLFFCRKE